MLKHPSLSADDRRTLRSLLVQSSPTYDFDRDDPDLQADTGPSVAVHVRLNEDLWRRLPQVFLVDVYSRFPRDGGRPGLIFELPADRPRATQDAFVEWIADLLPKISDSPDSDGVLLSALLRSKAGWALAVTPFVWRHLNRETRQFLIEEHLNDNACARGIKCRVNLTAENLDEVARQFGGGHEAKVRAQLTWELVRAGGRQTVLDLAQILPPFMRTRLGTFNDCSGLSCYATGLDADREDGYSKQKITTSTLEHRLRSEYRFVDPGEPPRLGDLMVFTHDVDRPEPVHVATYITDEIVFTKNGMSRYHPYVLQRTRDNIAVYFSDGKYRQILFRRVAKGERAIGGAWFRHAKLGCAPELQD